MLIKMEVFEAKPKRGGNSSDITIPKNVIENEKITSKKKMKFLIIGTEMDNLKEAFGTLKLKKPTQKVMEEIDGGYD